MQTPLQGASFPNSRALVIHSATSLGLEIQLSTPVGGQVKHLMPEIEQGEVLIVKLI